MINKTLPEFCNAYTFKGDHMATKKTIKKSTNKKVNKVKDTYFYRVVCNKCDIQLTVRKEYTSECLLCESKDIVCKQV